MSNADFTVLVIEDDLVANMHAGIVRPLPGFTVAATVNTMAAACEAGPVDLALVDVTTGTGPESTSSASCTATKIVLSGNRNRDDSCRRRGGGLRLSGQTARPHRTPRDCRYRDTGGSCP